MCMSNTHRVLFVKWCSMSFYRLAHNMICFWTKFWELSSLLNNKRFLNLSARSLIFADVNRKLKLCDLFVCVKICKSKHKKRASKFLNFLSILFFELFFYIQWSNGGSHTMFSEHCLLIDTIVCDSTMHSTS